MKQIVIAFLLCVAPIGAMAQRVSVDTLHAYGIYDTDRLPPSFHASRRDSVLAHMGAHSIALFLAIPEQNRANDDNFLYHQDPTFYYLTGLLEPSSALVLSKDGFRNPDGKLSHAAIFVQPRDPDKETWTGKRLGPQGATAVLGFQEAFVIDSLKGVLKTLLPNSDTLYYTARDKKFYTPLLDSTIELWQDIEALIARRYPHLTIVTLTKTLAALRSVKTPEELVLMRKAIAISNQAHNEIMKNVRPGWHEYEIQALGEYIFTKNGAEYTGYPSIVGSGENSTILHYETNRRETKSGDFVEMDMGAEYHGYTADVTRSYPVNGVFTPEQRIIYNLVLEAQDSGINQARKGNVFWAPHFAASEVIKHGLFKLGIIKDTDDYKTYFMHGTSHYLGTDVHDAGLYGPLAPGNVITVEPGIYIKAGSPCDPKWWNIGCRIEDDILITDGEAEILSRGSPRKLADVEKLMKH